MNETEERIEQLNSIIIDPEFEKVCPPLTEDEFSQLEQNILSDGAVTSPLVVWNNILIDGHHRRQIILKHPELPFRIREMTFSNKYEVIVWICKNQAGRRNLTPEQFSYLVGKRYQAEKQSKGASDGFRGNQYVDLVVPQNEELPNSTITGRRIAKEYGIGHATVERDEQYAKGVDAAEAACPGVKQELLSGSFKPTKKEVSDLSKLPAEEVADRISEYRKAQAEREERKQQAQEEKHTQATDGPRKIPEEERTVSERTVGIDFEYLTANGADGLETQKNYDSIVGIIRGAAERMQGTCDNYFADYPEMLEQITPQICEALLDLKHYIDNIFEKRRQQQGERQRQADDVCVTKDHFSSIADISLYMEEHKRRADASSMIEAIKDMARDFKNSCEAFSEEFPEMLGSKKPQLIDATDALTEYLLELRE